MPATEAPSDQELPLETGLGAPALDGCNHDFATLASKILPEHFARLQTSMAAPLAMHDFAQPKVGVAALLKRHGRGNDFSGCYVLSADSSPWYVGISRSVFKRLRDHVTGGTHYNATLAYRMAKGDEAHGLTRDKAMATADFLNRFTAKRQELRGFHAAYVEIPNPVELYLFEVYAAMTLKTTRWNTFRTH